MNLRFRKTRVWEKALCLFLAAAFLTSIFSCAHSRENSRVNRDTARASSIGDARAAGSYSGEDPWWKKPEYEWLIATLIVIGAGVAAGAAIMISTGAGGLSVHVQK